MGRFARSQSVLTLCGLGVCCALAAVVVGAPLIDQGKPLQLPNLGGKVQIWPPGTSVLPLGLRVATKVAITSGQAKVVDQNNLQVAMVPAGFTCVIEGDYSLLEAEAMLAPTAGSYDTRGPCDYSGPDMGLGAGTLAFTASGPHPYTFYGAQSALQRLVIVGASGGTATLKDGNNNLLLTLEPGDTSFCSRNVAQYKADGPTGTIVSFDLSEFTGPSGTYSGNASAQAAGDTDAAHLDGGAKVRLKVTHTGSSGTVTVTAAGCNPGSDTLAPGASREFMGFATNLSWTYSVAGCSVSFEVQRIP